MNLNNRLFTAVIGAAVLGAAPGAAAQGEKLQLDLSGTIDWVYDYENGKRLGRETGKPLFVVFRCER